MLVDLALTLPGQNDEIQEWRRQSQQRLDEIQSEIDRRRKKVQRLLNYIESGGKGDAVQPRILEHERAVARLRIERRGVAEIPDVIPGRAYAALKRELKRLAGLVARDGDTRERHDAALVLAGLVGRVNITPGSKRGETEIDIVPRFDAIIDLAFTCVRREGKSADAGG